MPVRSFLIYTADLLKACSYLIANHVTMVAMEATGVYLIPLYDLLENHHMKVFVVNGAHIKNVPGRKSDTQDCQWIQQLHSYRLLRSSFEPVSSIRKLRTYIRLRNDHIQMAC